MGEHSACELRRATRMVDARHPPAFGYPPRRAALFVRHLSDLFDHLAYPTRSLKDTRCPPNGEHSPRPSGRGSPTELSCLYLLSQFLFARGPRTSSRPVKPGPKSRCLLPLPSCALSWSVCSLPTTPLAAEYIPYRSSDW